MEQNTTQKLTSKPRERWQAWR